MMWILFAFGSAFFAGLTAILAKIGIRNMDSDLATALRTGVVLIFAWLMAFLTAGVPNFSSIEPKTLLFLVLSGISTGASWICYFKALQLGDVNKVTPIDKSSILLTMLLAFLFLGEPGYGDPNHLRAAHGLDHRIHPRETKRDPADRYEKLVLSDLFRRCHRPVLALLLPGAADWPGFSGSSH